VAEADGFEVLLSTDRNIRHQLNISGRRIAVLILGATSNRVSDLLPLMPLAVQALAVIQPGLFVEVKLPDMP